MNAETKKTVSVMLVLNTICELGCASEERLETLLGVEPLALTEILSHLRLEGLIEYEPGLELHFDARIAKVEAK